MKKYLFVFITIVIGMGAMLLSCTDENILTSSPESTDLEGYSQTFDGAANKNANHQVSDIFSFADFSLVAEDGATLLRTHNNVRMTIKTTDLDPHDTYTIWWVVFNNPEACESPTAISGCSEPDLFNPAVNASMLYAAGNVVGGNGKGNFAGSLREGDISGCQAPWDDFDLSELGVSGLEGEIDLCGNGLEDTQAAEIHLVVRTHGPKIPGQVNGQINTFAVGCTAESSFGAADGPNECEDQQFAIFLPE